MSIKLQSWYGRTCVRHNYIWLMIFVFVRVVYVRALRRCKLHHIGNDKNCSGDQCDCWSGCQIGVVRNNEADHHFGETDGYSCKSD